MEFLDQIALLSAWFWALPRTVIFFLYGLLLTYTIAAGGYALARSGIKPLWVLLLIVPTINVIVLWVWAYVRWPILNLKKES
jgi:hypothetical protein